MAEKTDAQVTIGGRTYTLSGYESEEYLHKVADYLNRKIDELSGDAEFARLSLDMRQLLLNINIADDYFKETARNEELQRLVDKKENDLYDIKHELVAAQMKLESAVRAQKVPADAEAPRKKTQKTGGKQEMPENADRERNYPKKQ